MAEVVMLADIQRMVYLTLLLIYRPQEDEWLSWPYSGRNFDLPRLKKIATSIKMIMVIVSTVQSMTDLAGWLDISSASDDF